MVCFRERDTIRAFAAEPYAHRRSFDTPPPSCPGLPADAEYEEIAARRRRCRAHDARHAAVLLMPRAGKRRAASGFNAWSWRSFRATHGRSGARRHFAASWPSGARPGGALRPRPSRACRRRRPEASPGRAMHGRRLRARMRPPMSRPSRLLGRIFASRRRIERYDSIGVAHYCLRVPRWTLGRRDLR